MELTKLTLLALCCIAFSAAEIINRYKIEDHCDVNPCGDGNTCFNTAIGYKCFCRPGEESPDCVQVEQCMLFNHTGTCRDACHEDETGIFISHLGDRFMDLKIYNKGGNVTVADKVPVEDVREQVPCMWQLTGKPNCCVYDPDGDKIGCFAYGSTVRTQYRGVVLVEQIKTGDLVEGMSESGELIYTPVIMIMHQESERVEEMIYVITDESERKLTLTHDHLLYVSRDSGASWSYLFSEKTQPGMLLTVTNGEGTTSVEMIKSVQRETRQGLYAPVTMTGNIVVDGIVVSCYGNYPDHYLPHMVFAPIRWMYSWAPWMYDGDRATQDGSHPYVSFLDNKLRSLLGGTLLMSQHRLDAMTIYP